jgi:succinyl-CoA synthetase alpha subunit
MMLASLNALNSDPDTQVIVLISKPPAPAVAARVLDRVRASPKPAVVCFLGTDPQSIEAAGAYAATDLTEAAILAATLAQGGDPAIALAVLRARGEEWMPTTEAECAKLAAGQWAVRGLFSGGTFCYEAQLLLQGLRDPVRSNAPLSEDLELPDVHVSNGHTVLDLGEASSPRAACTR